MCRKQQFQGQVATCQLLKNRQAAKKERQQLYEYCKRLCPKSRSHLRRSRSRQNVAVDFLSPAPQKVDGDIVILSPSTSTPLWTSH